MAYTYSSNPKNPHGLNHDIILCLTPFDADAIINNKVCKIALCKLNIDNTDTFFSAKLAKLNRDCLMFDANLIAHTDSVKILLATEGVIVGEIEINACKVLKYTKVEKDVYFPRFAFQDIFFFDFIYVAIIDISKTKEYKNYKQLDCSLEMQNGLIYRYKA